MSAGCVQNKRDLYPPRGNIWKSPPLVSSALKARLRYERTWSKASLAKAGWFRHIHRDANLSCSSSTHLPWFNIVTQPSLWDAPKEFRCLQVTVVVSFFLDLYFLALRDSHRFFGILFTLPLCTLYLQICWWKEWGALGWRVPPIWALCTLSLCKSSDLGWNLHRNFSISAFWAFSFQCLSKV